MVFSLTITALNLTGNEFISAFYFNFDPSLNAALYLPATPDTGTQVDWNSIGAGNDAFEADGDGFFDFLVDFPPPPGDADSKFTAGETFILTWVAATGLTTADFDFASVGGPEGKTGFYAAAHVQGIGSEEDSGWIGASGAAVPEPSSLLLFSCRHRTARRGALEGQGLSSSKTDAAVTEQLGRASGDRRHPEARSARF